MQQNNEVSKIKTRNDKYVKANLTEYEVYVINSISDWDAPKLRNCLVYKEHVNPNGCINEKGTTFLHYAASKQNSWTSELGGLDLLNVLLAHGADPTLKDSNGLTALDYATIKGFKNNCSILEKFVRRQADLEEKRQSRLKNKEENKTQE